MRSLIGATGLEGGGVLGGGWNLEFLRFETLDDLDDGIHLPPLATSNTAHPGDVQLLGGRPVEAGLLDALQVFERRSD